MTNSAISRRYIVSGRVQGVGFRYFVKRAAEDTGLKGWVRNLPDGTVEARAEGSAECLESFEAAVRRGPQFASVTGVKVEGMECAGYSVFDIRI